MIMWNMKVYGVDDTLYMLGFDPNVDPAGNILFTPTYVVGPDDLEAYATWHDTIMEARRPQSRRPKASRSEVWARSCTRIGTRLRRV